MKSSICQYESFMSSLPVPKVSCESEVRIIDTDKYFPVTYSTCRVAYFTYLLEHGTYQACDG
jgi:hypothetical protein